MPSSTAARTARASRRGGSTASTDTSKETTVRTIKSGGKTASTPARKPNAAAQRTAKKTTTAAKPAAAKKSSTVKKSVSIDLTVERETANKVVLKPAKGAKDPIITGLYVSKAGLAVFEEQDSLQLTFEPHSTQPKNSFRFNETGEDNVVGSLYLMREPSGKAGITDAKNVGMAIVIKDEDTMTVVVTAL